MRSGLVGKRERNHIAKFGKVWGTRQADVG